MNSKKYYLIGEDEMKSFIHSELTKNIVFSNAELMKSVSKEVPNWLHKHGWKDFDEWLDVNMNERHSTMNINGPSGVN